MAQDNLPQDPKIIGTHGGYRKLLSYQKAEIIFDGTHYFTQKYFRRFDRTIDQMIQAARSGKQNIAEASLASATSKETEIKLTNVARASLEELLIDYQDYLRIHHLPEWQPGHRWVEQLCTINRQTTHSNYQTFKCFIEHPDPEYTANTLITLIKICTYLLSKQIERLESDFLKHGGLREKMTQARYNSLRKPKP
ncbi:four helix bundle protein [bacterium]|nr:four helix bundle protein [bacterium]